MDIISIIFIAIGLAMDTFAVSIASGFAIKFLKVGNALKIALFFGLFHGMMPLIGWSEGLSLQNFLSSVDHWIAFGLLSIIGVKMIYESSKMGSCKNRLDPLNIYSLLMLSIATSIDALAVGLSLSFLQVSIALPAIVIGIVTFLLSIGGVYLGNRFGHYFERKIEIAGGVILIGIGIKILAEHLA